jgi:hypothetical protein
MQTQLAEALGRAEAGIFHFSERRGPMAKFKLDNWRPKPFKDPVTGKKQDDTGGGRDISRQIEQQRKVSESQSMSDADLALHLYRSAAPR